VLVTSVFWLYTLIQLVGNLSEHGRLAILITSGALMIDILAEHTKLFKKRSAWMALRTIELITFSICFFVTIGSINSMFFGIELIAVMLQLLMLTDFLDVYSRAISLTTMSLPAIIYMISMILLKPEKQETFFGMICAYLSLIFVVMLISELISAVLIATDKRIFELRRFSEETKETNEALRNQQEKFRKVNEELGIQKIMLEAAYHKINSANTETQTMYQIIRYISTELEIENLMKLITEAIYEAMGLDVCTIILEPEIAGNKQVTYEIHTRLGKGFYEQMSSRIEEGCIEEYMKEGNYIDNQVQPGKYSFLKDRKISSLLIVPLVREKKVIGALLCGHAHFEYFNGNIIFFETVVAQLLVAIHNASLYSKMQQMAIHDSLTGIYNRGQLNVILEQYTKRASEQSKSLSVALIDIDLFKKINDTYGHLFGDEVIKMVAIRLQEVANCFHGIAARYGGEEFVIVIPDVGISAFYHIITSLKETIDTTTLYFNGEEINVKVSVGISSYPETSVSCQQLLNRADGAMYYSKRNGRNSITMDNDIVQDYVRKNKETGGNCN
jgi:diguanylate cyclase (GGDEF)-like protein